MRYCFRCLECGATSTSDSRQTPLCPSSEDHYTGLTMVRDYRRENVSMGVVPGGYKDRNSTTMFDSDSLRDQGINLSRDEVEDRRSDALHAIDDFTNA